MSILVRSHVATADELPDCNTIRNAARKMECLQNSIAILQKQATGNVVQWGTKRSAIGSSTDGSAEKAIIELVKTTKDKASPNFVVPEAVER